MFKKIFISAFLLLLFISYTQISVAETDLPDAFSGQLIEMIDTVKSGSTTLSPGFNNPSAMWVQEIVVPVAWLILIVIFLKKSIRKGELTFEALLFISTTTMFWQEGYIDWGAYLLFNPKFALIPWGSTLFTAPNKLWSMIPCYGIFFTPVYLLFLFITKKMHSPKPDLKKAVKLIILVLPLIYIWDLITEGPAAVLGWATYTDYYGPALVFEKGTFPLVYPVLLISFQSAVAIWLLSIRSPDKIVWFESWFSIEKMKNGLMREIARIGAWTLVMNGVLFFFLTVPVVLVRILFGHPSILVP